MMAIVVHWPKQLTYPIERWPSYLRFKDENELEKLLDTVADSLHLAEACRKLGIDKGYIYRRKLTDKEFNARLRAAQDAALELLPEKAIKIMEDCPDDMTAIAKARAQQDGLIRLYGIAKRSQNLAQVNIVNNNDNRTLVVNDEQRQKLIELRNKALAQNTEQKE